MERKFRKPRPAFDLPKRVKQIATAAAVGMAAEQIHVAQPTQEESVVELNDAVDQEALFQDVHIEEMEQRLPAQAKRFETPKGPLHVFQSEGYDSSRGSAYVYIHGYGDSVDTTVQRHALYDQFVNSKQNGLFIAPEAPDSKGDSVRFTRLEDVLGVIEHSGETELPEQPTVVIAHSGGFRTVSSWLTAMEKGESASTIDTIVMLDAMYGADIGAQLERWVTANDEHRLVLVGQHGQPGRTGVRSKALATKLGAEMWGSIPLDLTSKAQPSNKVLYIESQVDHYEMPRHIDAVLRITGSSNRPTQ